MGNWNETGKEMGFDDGSENKFVDLNEGADEVVTYVDHARVTCTPNELEQGYCGDNGQTLEYKFTSPVTGKDRLIRRASKGLFYAFKGSKVEPGQSIRIVRTGTGPTDTRYKITVLSPEELAEWVAKKKAEMPLPATAHPPIQGQPPQAAAEEIRIEDIPF